MRIDNKEWNYTSDSIKDNRAELRMQKVLRYISVEGKHLDIGCGNGEGLRLISKIKDSYGIEYSPNAVKRAKSLGLKVLLADACDLPFPNDSFETITCLDVLEHIPAYKQAIEEMLRVLKPDGLLILQTPSIWLERIKKIGIMLFCLFHPFKATKKLKERKERGRNIQPFEHFYSSKTLEKCFHHIKKRQIRYWNESKIIEFFSFSNLYLIKK